MATGLVMCGMAAGSIIVFDDFGPDSSFMPGPGITVGCGAACWNNAGFSHAWSFVPSTTVTLSQVETVVSLGPSFTDSQVSNYIFTISADSGGLPGAYLESFGFPVQYSFPVRYITGPSGLRPTLFAGQTYWFTAFTLDLVNESVELGINPVGLTGPEALRLGDGAWYPTTSTAYAAFRVTGDPVVPEPSSIMLLTIAILGISVKPIFAVFRAHR